MSDSRTHAVCVADTKNGGLDPAQATPPAEVADAHNYQVGAGLTSVVVHRVDLFVEGIPLGERSLAAGAALAF
jgi:hypothetical protein